MNDVRLLEMSAKAMGWKTKVENYGMKGNVVYYQRDLNPKPDWCEWLPFAHDAQAMALVKKLGMTVDPQEDVPPFTWRVVVALNGDWDNQINACSTDLNRAIVECAAELQSAALQPEGSKE